jgi:hypothetical protein
VIGSTSASPICKVAIDDLLLAVHQGKRNELNQLENYLVQVIYLRLTGVPDFMHWANSTTAVAAKAEQLPHAP